MATKHGLGRGLGALIRDGSPAAATPAAEPAAREAVRTVPIARIRKSPWQPRRAFEEQALAELTESVRQRGVLQPLLVRSVGADYELIAGERRLRAATAVGLAEVPVTVMDAADRDALELALTENLQREDLNIMEEASGYQALADTFSLTQEDIAKRIGKARATVTNTLRLLALPEQVKGMIRDGQLSAGHAKVLLGLEIPAEQTLFAQRVIDETLSVRQLEKLVERAKRMPRKPRTTRSDIPPSHLTDLSDKLQGYFGTRVHLSPSRTYANGKKARGSIEIEFYSNEELDRILEILGIPVE